MTESPLVSFVICGRNDNYMGNYSWRIATAMNCLVRNLVRLGRQHDAEIILADWNSPVPFHKEMLLVPEARGLLRFLVVPPEVAIPAQKDSRFPNPIAQNAAIRRARGRYIAVSDADVIVPASSLLVLFAILEKRLAIGTPPEKTFLIASRAQVPVARTRHNPPLKEIEGFIDRNAALLTRDRLFEGLGAPAGLVLMARELWFQCRGYDERLIHQGWGDIELHLRLTQQYPWVDLANHSAVTVHLEHVAGGRLTSAPQRPYNGYAVSRQVAANDDHWGLGQANLALHDPEAVLDAVAETRIAAAAAKVRSTPSTIETIGRELQLPEVTKILQFVHKNLPHPTAELDALQLLAWYARQRLPRTYVELGVANSTAHVAVLVGCPTCECYLIDQWSENDRGGDRPVYHVSRMAGAGMVTEVGSPQAQTHFITGDMPTALPRLFEAIAPGLDVDLALLRTHPRFGDAVTNALLLDQRLAPGGAIVVSSGSRAEYTPVWNALSAQFPDRIRLEVQGSEGEVRCGMVLAVPVAV
jgi:hypothetical protein